MSPSFEIYLKTMGQKKYKIDEQRRIIVRLRQQGMIVNRIARTLGISTRTVSRVWRRFGQTARTTRKTRSGRPRNTSARDDRRLQRLRGAERFKYAAALTRQWNEDINIRTSVNTTRRRFHAWGIYSRYARRKPLISVTSRAKRVRQCNSVRIWNLDDHLAKICFSDESRFNLGYNDGRVRVWRSNGTAIDPDNLALVRRQGATSVMVWG